MSGRSGPLGRDLTEEFEQANYPSDHNSVTSTFVIRDIDDTVLDFRALGQDGNAIPAGYGHRVLSSPDVSLEWRVMDGQDAGTSWQYAAGTANNNGAARLALDDAPGPVPESLTYAIQLSTFERNRVQLDSFTLLNESIETNADASVSWEVWRQGERVEQGTILIRSVGERRGVPLSTHWDATELELRWRIDSAYANGVAIDDILFRQILVPEPQSAMSCAVALVSMGGFARRKLRRQWVLD